MRWVLLPETLRQMSAYQWGQQHTLYLSQTRVLVDVLALVDGGRQLLQHSPAARQGPSEPSEFTPS